MQSPRSATQAVLRCLNARLTAIKTKCFPPYAAPRTVHESIYKAAALPTRTMLCGIRVPYRSHHKWFRSDRVPPDAMTRSSIPVVNPAEGFPHQHTRHRKIGQGSEGFVEAWTHNPTGFIVAVKVITSKKKLPIEVEIMKELPYHSSVLTCFAFLPRQSRPNGDCIFLEYCQEGDLFDLQRRVLKINQSSFSEAFVWSVYSQLCSAIAFLHQGVGCPNPTDADFWRPVVHRDIKLENVLISTLGNKDDYSGIVIKLGDFGLSAFYDPSDTKMPGAWGTSVLWPPEQTWEERKATLEGDIWAVGCVVHELTHGFPPVQDPAVTERMAVVENKIEIPCNWSESMRKSFWSAKAPRAPLPINIDPKQHAWDERRTRPTPRYSNKLNEAMMMALNMLMADRATATALKAQVDEDYAGYLFEDFKAEHEAFERQENEDEDEGGDEDEDEEL